MLECESFKDSYGFYKVGVEKAELEELNGMIPVEVNGSSVSSPFIIEAGKEQWFRFQTGSVITPTTQLRGQLYTLQVIMEQPVPGQIEMELYRVINQQRYFVKKWSQLITTYRFADQATYDVKVKLSDFIGTYRMNISSSDFQPIKDIYADDDPVRITVQEGRKNESWFVFRPSESGSYTTTLQWVEGELTLPTIHYYVENDSEGLKLAYTPTQNIPKYIGLNRLLEAGDQVSYYIYSERGFGTYDLQIHKREPESMPIRIRREIESDTYQTNHPVKIRLIIDILDESDLATVGGNPGTPLGHSISIRETPPANVSFFYGGKEVQNEKLYDFYSVIEDTVIEYFIIPNKFVHAPLHFYGEGTITPRYSDDLINVSYETVIEGDSMIEAVESSIKDWDLY